MPTYLVDRPQVEARGVREDGENSIVLLHALGALVQSDHSVTVCRQHSLQVLVVVVSQLTCSTAKRRTHDDDGRGRHVGA